MGDLFTPVHLIVVLGIALLVFGPKRLPELGAGLGKSLREFREATSGMSNPFSQDSLVPAQAPRPSVDPGTPTGVDAAAAPPETFTADAVEADMDTGG